MDITQWQGNNESNPVLCVSQGVMIQFSEVASMMWTAIIAFTLQQALLVSKYHTTGW